MEPDITAFAAELGVHPITARILQNRGITTVSGARLFLDSPISALHDPLLLPDVQIAVDRIVRAIHTKEPITIYGDYDTDGVCSATLMLRFFREMGIPVAAMLPHRARDGYGLTVAAVDRILAAGKGILITVDNGTSALEAVAHAQASGLDVIITDHHQCKDHLPKALACINPHRTDSRYPFKDLCGAGVAFKLLIALRYRLRTDGFFAETQPNLQQLLPYVAIATIADVMPLTGENRILVKRGLQMLATHPGPGLAALMRLAAITPAELDAEDVAFRIAPRINAAGRLDDATIALQCLSEDDAIAAAEAANILDQLNTRRQAIEQQILRELDAPEQKAALTDVAGIAIGDASYPIGVVGIIAGRLARNYRKPAVVVSFETGVGKGSVRSISGLDIVPVLADCAAHLLAYGGHAQAAGITVTPDQWPAFQTAFAHAVADRMADCHHPAQTIDAHVATGDLTLELGRDLRRLAPFGAGNPEPVLAVQPTVVQGRRQVGANHLKMRIGDTTTTVDAIGFGLWNHPDAQNQIAHLIGVPELNTWNGETRLQLRILDINPPLFGSSFTVSGS